MSGEIYLRAGSTRGKSIPLPLERDVLRACLALLKLRGVFAWRTNQGGVPLKEGGFRPGPTRGVSDIIGVLPGGRFLAVECKRIGGRVSEEQWAFLESVTRAGGLALIAHSAEELDAQLSAAKRK